MLNSNKDEAIKYKYNLVASSYFTEFNYDFDYSDVNKRFFQSLYKERLVVIYVNCYDIDNLNMGEYSTYSLAVTDKINFRSNEQIIFLQISFRDLINYSFGNINTPNIISYIEYGQKDKSYKYEIIFCFQKTIWFKLLFSLAKHYIYISGGDSTRRHLLSKNEILLSNFITCFDKNYMLHIKQNIKSDIELISTKSYTDSKFITNLKIKDPILKELFINFQFNFEMLHYISNYLYDYIEIYENILTKFEDPKLLEEYSKDQRIEIINMNKEAKEHSKIYIVITYMHALNLMDKKGVIKKAPNYIYLKSLLYLCKDCEIKTQRLKNLILKVYPDFENKILGNKKLEISVKHQILENKFKSRFLTLKSNHNKIFKK